MHHGVHCDGNRDDKSSALVLDVQFMRLVEEHCRASRLFALLSCEAKRRTLEQEDAAVSPFDVARYPESAFVSRDKEQWDCFIENGGVGAPRKFGDFVEHRAQLATRIRSLLAVCNDEVHFTKRRHARDVASPLSPTRHPVWTVLRRFVLRSGVEPFELTQRRDVHVNPDKKSMRLGALGYI